MKNIFEQKFYSRRVKKERRELTYEMSFQQQDNSNLLKIINNCSSADHENYSTR